MNNSYLHKPSYEVLRPNLQYNSLPSLLARSPAETPFGDVMIVDGRYRINEREVK